MNKQDVLKDLVKLFEDNKTKSGLTDVHGVYESLKEYMMKLKIEIDFERRESNE